LIARLTGPARGAARKPAMVIPPRRIVCVQVSEAKICFESRTRTTLIQRDASGPYLFIFEVL
jgi:hypothetical protein